MGRPADLPEFERPPLNEFILGIQFNPVEEYSQIYAGDVWRLYKDDFPKVEEQAALAPSFETFGPSHGGGRARIQLMPAAGHDRFWFVAPDDAELIQFQQDRLLHNWRKRGEAEYPRFEPTLDKFVNEMKVLEGFFSSISSEPLSINQAEISYVNQIVGNGGAPLRADEWFGFLNFSGDGPDDYSGQFRLVLRDESGVPYGRFVCEIKSVTIKQQPGIQFTMTVRGAPRTTDIGGAIEFFKDGREIILKRFVEITTEKAHSIWGRTQ